MRISSALQSYNSGDLPLTFETDGRSLFYLWNTGNLKESSDYTVDITLRDKYGNVILQSSNYSGLPGEKPPDATVHLANSYAEPSVLAASTDAQAPAAGSFCIVPFTTPTWDPWAEDGLTITTLHCKHLTTAVSLSTPVKDLIACSAVRAAADLNPPTVITVS